MRSGARVVTQRSTVQPWAVATLSKVRRNASGSSVGFILGSITGGLFGIPGLPGAGPSASNWSSFSSHRACCSSCWACRSACFSASWSCCSRN
ncbi:hypothetical protein FKM82_020969 [Ascaphus truei]